MAPDKTGVILFAKCCKKVQSATLLGASNEQKDKQDMPGQERSNNGEKTAYISE